jgi:hypothetical protein
MIRPVLAAAALLASTAAQAQSAAVPCIPQRDAEALFLAVAPALIDSVATTCATALPATAILRRSPAALRSKFVAESDVAWPRAKAGLRTLLGPDAAPMVDSELARPMLSSMVGPMLAKDVKPGDCAGIDRVLTLIDPLPARNVAGLVVTLLDVTGAAKARAGRKAAFTLCSITKP